MSEHDAYLDDAAALAIGALSLAEAERVRAHLAICEECRAEYVALAPLVGAISTPEADLAPPSPLLRERIMAQVAPGAKVRSLPRSTRAPAWPLYLVAAASFVAALVSTFNLATTRESMNQMKTRVVALQRRVDSLTHSLQSAQMAAIDLTSADATRMPVHHGEIVMRHGRMYLAMHDMPMPPRGHVYQAWVMPRGGKKIEPSATFMPDRDGVAVVPIAEHDAGSMTEVAVSVEPVGGSKQPTTKPMFVASLE